MYLRLCSVFLFMNVFSVKYRVKKIFVSNDFDLLFGSIFTPAHIIANTDTYAVKLSIDLQVWMSPHWDVDHGHL